MKTSYSFLFLFIFLLISCQNSIPQEEIKEEKLDSFIQLLKDTTTKSGFEVRYEAKENSSNLIVQIKKDTLFKEFVLLEVLDMKIKNCPILVKIYG